MRGQWSNLQGLLNSWGWVLEKKGYVFWVHAHTSNSRVLSGQFEIVLYRILLSFGCHVNSFIGSYYVHLNFFLGDCLGF